MQNYFEPQEMALFGLVFDTICADIRECDKSTERMVALRILSRAQIGDWDFPALMAAARVATAWQRALPL